MVKILDLFSFIVSGLWVIVFVAISVPSFYRQLCEKHRFEVYEYFKVFGDICCFFFSILNIMISLKIIHNSIWLYLYYIFSVCTILCLGLSVFFRIVKKKKERNANTESCKSGEH